MHVTYASCVPECKGNMNHLMNVAGFPQTPETTLAKQLELSGLSNGTVCLKEGQSDLANC